MSQSRQLAAIMFTDIAGYTALMEEDEQKAFDLLKRNRQIQRPTIEKHSGLWLKEIGDGVLASFKTITDAVYAAKEIQKSCESEPDLKLRIGIHQGEVVFEGEDVFGSGVNIASRLEPLAPIGGILVSESVHNNVRNIKDISTKFFGEKQLRGMIAPVKVYEVQVEGVNVFEPISSATDIPVKDIGISEKRAKNYNHIILGVAIIILTALGYIYYANTIGSETINISESEIIEKSIVVLPFRNMSGDPEQEALCDGLTDEIIHHLSKIKSFDKVISLSSAMSLKNSEKTLPEKAALLRVNTVLEGSFRQSGDQIKIIAQLIDGANDNHLWSETYERPIGDILDIQSDIAKKIAARFNAEITPEEAARLDKKPTESSEAYMLLKKGLYKMGPNSSDQDFSSAITLLKKAIEIDENLAEAYSALAKAYMAASTFYLADKSIPVEDPLPLIKKALTLDPNLTSAHNTMGFYLEVMEWTGFLDAKKSYLKAIELDPMDPAAKMDLAYAVAKNGEMLEAVSYAEAAFKVSPIEPFAFESLAKFHTYAGNYIRARQIMSEFELLFPNEGSGHTGQIYLYLEDFDRAIFNLKKGISVPLYNGSLAIAYHKNGQPQKAQQVLARLDKMKAEERFESINYSIGLYYSAIGDIEKALNWLELAYESHDVELYWLKSHPFFKPLHGHPRYVELLSKIGFPE